MSKNIVKSKQKDFYNWLAGLIDGEGCFCVGLRRKYTCKRKTYETFQFTIKFSIGMSLRELTMLKLIKKQLKIGHINICKCTKYNYSHAEYRIQSKDRGIFFLTAKYEEGKMKEERGEKD